MKEGSMGDKVETMTGVMANLGAGRGALDVRVDTVFALLRALPPDASVEYAIRDLSLALRVTSLASGLDYEHYAADEDLAARILLGLDQ